MNPEINAILSIIINSSNPTGEYKIVYKYDLVWNKESQRWLLRIWYNTKRAKCCCLRYAINKYIMRAIRANVHGAM